MGAKLYANINTHVVDILGNVKGRDQPIMLMEKALLLVSTLDESIFLDEDVVFFDPFCKAGEILLASVFKTCMLKQNNRSLMSVNQITEELYNSNRYFALAPDERHHKLSLRTFLGNEHSHSEEFNHIIRNGSYLSEVDGRLDIEKYEKEFVDMLEYIKNKSGKKKIVAVGNPPYQESDGGFGGSAKAIYNFFAEALMDSEDINEFALVIPSRWFTTGKGAKEFRERITQAKNIKSIRHFKHSKTVFPTVDVLGGICFLHYQDSHNGDVNFIDDSSETKVDLSKYDIVLDDPKGYSLIGKIKNKWDGSYVSEIAWSVRPFAIRTFYFKRNGSLDKNDKNAIPCFSKNRKIQYANINDIPKNLDKIDEWQVAVPRAYAPGSKIGVRRVTLPVDQYFIIPKGHITTETYNVVGSFKRKREAENFMVYLQSDFGRYFLGLRKVTQDIYQNQWSWLPLLDFSERWSDSEIYEYFGITKKEQEHIKAKLKEWS